MRRLTFTAVLALFAAACGGEESPVTNDGGSHGVDSGQVVDAACAETPPVCLCRASAVCEDGAWGCPSVFCAVDAASRPVDAATDGGGVCGGACDPATEYCQVTIFPNPNDAGSAMAAACRSIPASCGPSPTCACLPAGGACTCVETNGGFTVTCDVVK